MVIGIILVAVVFFVIGALVTAGTAAAASSSRGAEGLSGGMLILLFLFVGLFWLLLVGSLLTRPVLLIVHAIKASSGQWSEMPVVARWSKKFCGVS